MIDFDFDFKIKINKMGKRLFYTIFITLIISININAQAQKWTLNKCIEYAYENNIQIKQNKLSNQLNVLEIEQLKANRLPSLNASDNQSFNWGRK